MALYVEYTTLADIHTMTGSPGTTQDTYYADLNRSTSRELDEVANRRFVPVIQTQVYDVPQGGVTYPSGSGVWSASGQGFNFDADLLELTTLTNGDGTVIASTQYLLLPANNTPKYRVQLKNTATVGFSPDSSSNYQQALSVLGIWGYHNDYGAAWASAGTLTDAGGISSAATSYTASAGHGLKAGQLAKIESEMVYVSAVSVNAITIVRAANGSTAAAHAQNVAVSVWFQPFIEILVRTAVIAYARLKDNPAGDAVDVGGYRFMTPKDVTKWIDQRCRSLGIIKQGFA